MNTITKYTTVTRPCEMCSNTEHTFQIVEGCERCGSAHGPSHEPFTKGHQPHCTGNCCF